MSCNHSIGVVSMYSEEQMSCEGVVSRVGSSKSNLDLTTESNSNQIMNLNRGLHVTFIMDNSIGNYSSFT